MVTDSTFLLYDKKKGIKINELIERVKGIFNVRLWDLVLYAEEKYESGGLTK